MPDYKESLKKKKKKKICGLQNTFIIISFVSGLVVACKTVFRSHVALRVKN